jgi:hypothetical protein
MMREKAFKVYYTKGLICSSKPAENCTKPVEEKGEKADTGFSSTVNPSSAGVIRTFILAIRAFFAVKYRLLKRVFLPKKTGSSNEWRVIYRAYRQYDH